MRNDGCNDADEIDVVASDQRAPVTFDVFNAEFVRDFLSMFATGAGDRHNPHAVASFEAGNLRGARKARADDADANCVVRGHYTLRTPQSASAPSDKTGHSTCEADIRESRSRIGAVLVNLTTRFQFEGAQKSFHHRKAVIVFSRSRGPLIHAMPIDDNDASKAGERGFS